MNWFGLGALLGATGVAFGAFGAHALKSRVSEDLLVVFEIGVRYQMYHALALLALGLIARNQPTSLTTFTGWFFTLGVLIFSGSLYVMALTGIRWLGAITPIGGSLLILGWLTLAWYAFQSARV